MFDDFLDSERSEQLNGSDKNGRDKKNLPRDGIHLNTALRTAHNFIPCLRPIKCKIHLTYKGWKHVARIIGIVTIRNSYAHIFIHTQTHSQ